MSGVQSRQVRLAAHPVGMPQAGDFALAEATLPAPGPGQVLCRTIYVSLDPYMRGRISGRTSYAEPTQPGDVMPAGVVGQVMESGDPRFRADDFVFGAGGWQTHFLQPGAELRKLDPTLAPISTAVGVLGMPGLTAYGGLLELGRPREAETVVVSAASGAVGGVVGQIARIKGCRVVGFAGGPEKCRYVVEDLGFDGCVDHRRGALQKDLKALAPDGLDVIFENVGGEVFKTALRQMNLYARVVICGFVSGYNDTAPPEGPDILPELLGHMIVKRPVMSGLLVSDFEHLRSKFEREVAGWIRDGSLKYREDIVQGLENAVTAFQGLLSGKNFGKLMVQVEPDPTR